MSATPPEAIAKIEAIHAVMHATPPAGSRGVIHARIHVRTLAAPRKVTGVPRPTAPNAANLAESPVATSALTRVVIRARPTAAPTTTPAP